MFFDHRSTTKALLRIKKKKIKNIENKEQRKEMKIETIETTYDGFKIPAKRKKKKKIQSLLKVYFIQNPISRCNRNADEPDIYRNMHLSEQF